MVFGFLKGNPREAIFKATQASYDKHYNLARKQGIEPIQMGLFGALGSRYKLRRVFKNDLIHMVEIVPFVMMKEEDRVAALALYLLWFEMPQEVDESALSRWINEAFRDREDENAEDAYQFLVQSLPALQGSGILWLTWLNDVNTKRLAQDSLDAMDRK